MGNLDGGLVGKFCLDSIWVMSKVFWLENSSWILDGKSGQRFGQKVSVGSQLEHSARILLENCEKESH